MENFIPNTIFQNIELFALSDPPQLEKRASERLLIVIQGAIEDDKLELLKKIVEAIQLDFASEVHLLNLTPNHQFGFFELMRQNDFSDALLFGCDLPRLGIHAQLPYYRLVERDGFRLIFADSLAELESNINLKKRLWQALQQGLVQAD